MNKTVSVFAIVLVIIVTTLSSCTDTSLDEAKLKEVQKVPEVEKFLQDKDELNEQDRYE